MGLPRAGARHGRRPLSPAASPIDAASRPPLERWATIPVLGAVALALLQISLFHDWRHDDAYISYRYAQNLAEGHGLVFNPGQRVMGSTAPGHVLLAAALYRGVGHASLPEVMALLGCLAWMAQAVALFLLLRRPAGRWAAALVALGVGLGFAGSMRWVALETNLVVALVLFALLACLEEHAAIGALLAGFAVLLRPDALLPAGLLGLGLLWHVAARSPSGESLLTRSRPLWRPGICFVAPLLPWLVFAWAYFGSLLPQSASAKFQRESFGDYALHLLRQPAETLLPFELGPLGILVAWLLAALGAVCLVRADRRLVFLPLYGALHALAYLWLRPFVQHVWHLYPYTLVFTVLVLAGIAAPLFGPPVVRPRSATVLRASRLASVVAMVILVAGWGRVLAGEPYTIESPYFADRHAAYLAVAGFLDEQARPGDRVATVEIGTVGYYTGLPMLDLGGLVTTEEGSDDPYGFEWLVLDRFYADRLSGHPAWRLENGAFVVYVASNRDRSLDGVILQGAEFR